MKVEYRSKILDFVLGMVHQALSQAAIVIQNDALRSSEPDIFDEMKKEIDTLMGKISANKAQEVSMPLDVEGLGNVVNASVRLAVKDRNPELVGLLLETVSLLTDCRQIDINTKDSRLLQYGAVAFSNGEPPECALTTQSDAQAKVAGESVAIGRGIKFVLSDISSLLPQILPTESGFSQQAIQFLSYKRLFVSHDDPESFKLRCIGKKSTNETDDNAKRYLYGLLEWFAVTKDTTTFSADSQAVDCAVSKSEAIGTSFDHVWLPCSAQRLIFRPLVSICLSYWYDLRPKSCTWLFYIPVILAALIAFGFALLGLTLYPLLLLRFFMVHGFNSYEELGGTSSADDEASTNGTANGKGISIMQALQVVGNICCKPIKQFFYSLQGTQRVAGHVLSLQGVGSLKFLQALCTAPIDVFETPAVRAAVDGMWSRFVVGFWVRVGLYLVHLLLFSAFSAWCIAQDLSYSTVNSLASNHIVRASFNGGCVAVGICTYFLLREAMQCVACVTDEGLKDYIEFWNVLQACSLSLELASFAMFVSGSDPVTTRLVTTYAVFCLWINLLYFTKAIRQISFLLEILVTIVKDMIPFLCIMAVFVMAAALALQVLVGNFPMKMISPEDPDSEEVVFASFGYPLDLVLRMAEGRQDMADSVLEKLTIWANQTSDEGAARNGIFYTIYLCFYFLFFFITIIALNALIALMGSSYEKVVENKIPQRWHLILFLFKILTV
jgi:hypothetical protein